MIDIIIFVLLSGIVTSLYEGVGKGAIFAVALLVAVILTPMILMFIIGTPLGLIRRYILHSTSGASPAGSLQKDLRAGRVLGGVSEIVAYAGILIVSYNIGRPYLYGALAGLLVKLVYDSMWGDLPFQQVKARAD